MRIRILTFNVGLMRISLGGITLFENPAGVDARSRTFLSRVRDVCRRARADVVCVQECYEQEHRDMLKITLRPDYPFMATSHFHTWINSGIMTFSKHPILSFRRVPHTDQCRYERVLGDRSMLVARIAYNGDAPVTIVNVHLSSGCPSDSAEMLAIRHRQIRDIDATIDINCPDSEEPVVVAGDLNCGPQVTPRNYEEMVRLGWMDAWTASHGPGDIGITWDKSNPLNVNKLSLHGRSLRCDHVWVARRVDAATVHGCALMEDADPVSDHYAVAADISFSKAPTTGRA